MTILASEDFANGDELTTVTTGGTISYETDGTYGTHIRMTKTGGDNHIGCSFIHDTGVVIEAGHQIDIRLRHSAANAYFWVGGAQSGSVDPTSNNGVSLDLRAGTPNQWRLGYNNTTVNTVGLTATADQVTDFRILFLEAISIILSKLPSEDEYRVLSIGPSFLSHVGNTLQLYGVNYTNGTDLDIFSMEINDGHQATGVGTYTTLETDDFSTDDQVKWTDIEVDGTVTVANNKVSLSDQVTPGNHRLGRHLTNPVSLTAWDEVRFTLIKEAVTATMHVNVTLRDAYDAAPDSANWDGLFQDGGYLLGTFGIQHYRNETGPYGPAKDTPSDIDIRWVIFDYNADVNAVGLNGCIVAYYWDSSKWVPWTVLPRQAWHGGEDVFFEMNTYQTAGATFSLTDFSMTRPIETPVATTTTVPSNGMQKLMRQGLA